MTESTKGGFMNGPRTAWKNPKARKGMLMVGGMAVVVIGVTVAMGSKEQKVQAALPASASLTAPSSAGVQGDQLSQTSPEYKEKVRAFDQQRLKDSEGTPGAMVLPKITGLSDPNVPPAPEPVMSADVSRGTAPAPINGTYQGSQGGPKVPTPEERARTSPAYKSAYEMLQSQVTKSMEPAKSAWEVIRPPAAQVAGSAGTQAGNNQQAQGVVFPPSGGAGVPTLSAPALPIIGMGTTLFATIDTAINSDYTGPVKATIRQGRFAGAQLIGSKSLESEAVVVKFNLMSLPGGEAAIPVVAYAVSVSDARKFGSTGLSGTVDRHIFSRYVIPAAMAFVSGYGQIASLPRQEIIQTPNGYTQTTAPMEKRDRWIAAAGVAVQPLVSDLEKQASRPATINIDANEEVGIMFAADVSPKTQSNYQGASANTQAQVSPGLGQPSASEIQQMYAQQAQQQAAMQQAAMQQYGGGQQQGYPNQVQAPQISYKQPVNRQGTAYPTQYGGLQGGYGR